ncbi:glycosyl hydrolase 53 family protein, partial [Bacillus subtilis]|uniref:glycosyl hydrolase 53 family protein n=1 Tax=Bacillus subtilis TaxID=1423 RepID=UPI001642DD54
HSTNISQLFNQPSPPLTDTNSNIFLPLHFTNPQTPPSYSFIPQTLTKNKLHYHLFPTSYYPFSHPTLQNFTSLLNPLPNTYPKKLMLTDTSYTYTAHHPHAHANTPP